MSENKENTTVETVDMDISDILNIGDSVMLPSNADDQPKNSIFSRKGADLSFLEKPASTLKKEADDAEKAQNTPGTETTTENTPAPETIINEIVNDDEDNDPKKAGRPKMEKDALVKLTNKLIEKKMIVPFDEIGRAHV